jgi:hypothetical protein
MDPKGMGMVVNDKTKESIVNEPKDDKPSDSGSSHKKRDGKKKRRIKKIIYYDSDESSSSPRDDDYDEKKKPANSNFSFDYSRILFNSYAHLLSIPLGKPQHFDGEDYSFWSHKMRSHLLSGTAIRGTPNTPKHGWKTSSKQTVKIGKNGSKLSLIYQGTRSRLARARP